MKFEHLAFDAVDADRVALEDDVGQLQDQSVENVGRLPTHADRDDESQHAESDEQRPIEIQQLEEENNRHNAGDKLREQARKHAKARRNAQRAQQLGENERPRVADADGRQTENRARQRVVEEEIPQLLDCVDKNVANAHFY